MSFHFQKAAELLFIAQYLSQYDDTIKFKLVCESRQTALHLSTVNVPPFSYTSVELIHTIDRIGKVAAIEPLTISWAVNAAFLVQVLSCFEPATTLTIEIAHDLTYLLLLQKKADCTGVQVSQVGVLHDLGPKLLIDHDVRELYTITDLRNFTDAVRAVCAGDDDRCDVSLRRVSPRACELTFRTTTVTSSLTLFLDEQRSAAKHLEGGAMCGDLHALSRLCGRTAKVAQKATLMVGFGSESIAQFRLDWWTEDGSRNGSIVVHRPEEALPLRLFVRQPRQPSAPSRLFTQSMYGPSLVSQLGETHGVVVYHSHTLAPAKLRRALNTFGSPTLVRSYVLQDNNYATIVAFAAAASNTACYLSLAALSDTPETCGIASVGWVHESSEETFAQRPYVRCTYVEDKAVPSASPPPTQVEEGYLVAYWKGVPEAQRADVAAMATKSATEVFEDEKEGGRMFARFASEDMANAFHSHVLSKYATMRRPLSYADATDFSLAKGKSTQ